MKTAEVAIEHVLVGFLTLFAFLVPFLDATSLPSIDHLTSQALIGVVGLAYLLGVVFDKVTDEVLSPLEDQIRLDLAQKELVDAPGEAAMPDPFPQDGLEFLVRAEGEARVEWMDSLRSRMRTCRGVAVLGVPASIGVVALLQSCAPVWVPGLALVTLALLLIAVFLGQRKGLKLPRTTSVTQDAFSWKGVRERSLKRLIPFVAYLVLSISCIVLEYLVGSWSRTPGPGYIALGGFVVSLTALWAWSRICRTYMRFLLLAKPEWEASAASAP